MGGNSRGIPRNAEGARDYFQKYEQQAEVPTFTAGFDFTASYVLSLYKGFHWNYEDLVPERPEELVLELVVSAGIVAINSYCIGSFFTYHSKREMETQQFSDLMESVSSYMELCDLPPSL